MAAPLVPVITAELADAALSCQALERARGLADWVGVGKQLTALRVLRPGDAVLACRHLGIDVPGPRLRSAREWLRLQGEEVAEDPAGAPWLAVEAMSLMMDLLAGQVPPFLLRALLAEQVGEDVDEVPSLMLASGHPRAADVAALLTGRPVLAATDSAPRPGRGHEGSPRPRRTGQPAGSPVQGCAAGPAPRPPAVRAPGP